MRGESSKARASGAQPERDATRPLDVSPREKDRRECGEHVLDDAVRHENRAGGAGGYVFFSDAGSPFSFFWGASSASRPERLVFKI